MTADGTKQVGMKYDGDKLRYDLVPMACIDDLAKILTFGAKKYAANSWQHVENGPDRYFAALMRHISAWRQGEEIDPESGMSHLAHAMCNVVFLMEFDRMREEPKFADMVHSIRTPDGGERENEEAREFLLAHQAPEEE